MALRIVFAVKRIFDRTTVHCLNVISLNESINEELPVTFNISSVGGNQLHAVVVEVADHVVQFCKVLMQGFSRLFFRMDKNKTVPNLEHQIALYKQKEVSNEKLYAIEDERWQLKYDKLKSKKLGIGFSFGYGVNTMGISPSINISLNYTLFRL